MASFVENALLTIKALIKVILLSKFKKLQKTDNLKTECVILGNGPSINNFVKQNLNFIENKSLVCVNYFANTNYYEKLKPQIYIIAAPEMWIDNVNENYIVSRNLLLDNLTKKTTWELTMYIGIDAKKYKHNYEKLSENSNIKIVYFNNIGIEGFKKVMFLFFRLNLGMPRPHNVLIPSLMLSINFGFNKIYIAGADHDWIKYITVADDNKVYLEQKHFYDENTSKPKPMKKLGKGERHLHEILDKFRLSLQGYFIIKEYAQKNKIQIYNITPNSYIDAFERKKID